MKETDHNSELLTAIFPTEKISVNIKKRPKKRFHGWDYPRSEFRVKILWECPFPFFILMFKIRIKKDVFHYGLEFRSSNFMNSHSVHILHRF